MTKSKPARKRRTAPHDFVADPDPRSPDDKASDARAAYKLGLAQHRAMIAETGRILDLRKRLDVIEADINPTPLVAVDMDEVRKIAALAGAQAAARCDAIDARLSKLEAHRSGGDQVTAIDRPSLWRRIARWGMGK